MRRIVVRVLFGEELAAGADDIGERLAPASEYINRPMLRQFPHPLPVGARERAGASRRGAFDARLDEEIARRRGRATGDERADVLDTLLATDGLTDQELKDQVVSLIGAGFDTTTATASWLVLRAAPDADVWTRLRDRGRRVGARRHPAVGRGRRARVAAHPPGRGLLARAWWPSRSISVPTG